MQLFEFLTGPNRTMATARVALIVEANHDPSAARGAAKGRTALERLIVPALVRLGAADPKAATATAAKCVHRLPTS